MPGQLEQNEDGEIITAKRQKLELSIPQKTVAKADANGTSGPAEVWSGGGRAGLAFGAEPGAVQPVQRAG
jgi:hypothetical protein